MITFYKITGCDVGIVALYKGFMITRHELNL